MVDTRFCPGNTRIGPLLSLLINTINLLDKQEVVYNTRYVILFLYVLIGSGQGPAIVDTRFDPIQP